MRAAVLVLMFALVAGCSSREPALVAITGTVQFEGKTAPGTGVTFWPTDSSLPDVSLVFALFRPAQPERAEGDAK